ncbi:MAG TPA: hypothetical protein DCS17_10080 [Flavobacterium sp.]|nr:hypothetical protein [Flavobacterium sp.]
MKKLLLCLSLSLFLNSCDKNCDEEIKQATEQYEKAIGYANGSSAAIIKLTADYNKKLSEINERCN